VFLVAIVFCLSHICETYLLGERSSTIYSVRRQPFHTSVRKPQISAKYSAAADRSAQGVPVTTRESPFANSPAEITSSHNEQPHNYKRETTSDYLPLTLENVRKVLEDVRPYLQSDGGDCSVAAIRGKVVFLKLEGACGSCSSSTVTLKHGVERRLKEVIPEIESVEQVSNDMGEDDLTEANVEKVLDSVRPFLKFTGGDVKLISLITMGSKEYGNLKLQLTGDMRKSVLHSVKLEILQRLKKAFPVLDDVEIFDPNGDDDDLGDEE